MQIAGGLLVGAACLGLSLRSTRLELVTGALREVSWPWVLLAIAGVLSVSAGKALRWRWLYPPSTPGKAWTGYFSILMIGQMLNLLIPVRLGEVARVGLMRHEGRPVGTTLGTIVVEKTVDLLAVELLLLLAVPLVVLPDWLRTRAGPAALLVGGGLFGGLLLLGRFRCALVNLVARLPEPARPVLGHWAQRLKSVLSSMLEGLAVLDGPQLARVLALTGAVWLVSLAVVRAMLAAFALTPDWGAALTLMIALTFSNWIPTSPGMIGVVGALAVVILKPFGVPEASSLAFGTLLNVVLILPPISLGGWAVWARLWRLRAATGPARLRGALGLAAVAEEDAERETADEGQPGRMGRGDS